MAKMTPYEAQTDLINKIKAITPSLFSDANIMRNYLEEPDGFPACVVNYNTVVSFTEINTSVFIPVIAIFNISIFISAEAWNDNVDLSKQEVYRVTQLVLNAINKKILSPIEFKDFKIGEDLSSTDTIIEYSL